MRKFLKKLLTLIQPKKAEENTSEPREVIYCDAPQTLERIIEHIRKQHRDTMEKEALPSDSINTIMFRSGARWYRDILLKELENVTATPTIGR